ncbi:hypothetical protein [Psychroserpens sp. SPM9]|uniref:hypothetical protein n=1 Tax=Psychroserpens sp. SPM9 TaxID=2975598 RepID=UPI0021A9612E|nr:hypothetical protein [Psychroserpens sp. SPM9]MDG5491434.1 hypothetical protein [Psychroserpens sp. SPM9]
MNKNTIDKLFKTLEHDFDTEIPNSGHEHRFLDKLKQQNNTVVNSSKKTNHWKPFLAVAATIVLCFSIFTVMQQQNSEPLDLASVSPELSQTQSFFTTAIEQELIAIEAQRSPETENMINDAMKALKVLEVDYESLQLDLTESGNDKRVIYAMITNFQNRINVLKAVLEHIEEVKNFKNNQNENTITI